MSYGLFYKYHGNRTNAAGPVLTIRIPLPIYWRWDIHSWHESIENINSQTTDSITTTNQSARTFISISYDVLYMY